MADLHFRRLDASFANQIAALAQQLNPDKPPEYLRACMDEMFAMSTYRCFGALADGRLVALSSGWLTTRFYSGRQLEINNVVVDERFRSDGIGAALLAYIEAWARGQGCKTIELNAYVHNALAHRFYFRHGYHILGFHFQKKM